MNILIKNVSFSEYKNAFSIFKVAQHTAWIRESLSNGCKDKKWNEYLNVINENSEIALKYNKCYNNQKIFYWFSYFMLSILKQSEYKAQSALIPK